ncbi:glycosyltransferase family 2 protein [Seonamhaeicola maritimus]|uniref:Glycosyltransferase n=1 Tax=Seonamhaeicola maritimus TaxID=2591822 RepID=A0A5C7GKR1_9FLAO|nr:glycosyltransferase [Seonamhaeicola maritimus]TXG38862.1 glycosyltransferase [Seonamhaeicola maritimus]
MSHKTTPLVSICIPTYNGETFLEEALDSAISQSYPNIEVVVSDDASTDATLDIIKAYKHKTSIPISVYNHKPQGIGANWNHCVKQVKGDYIKFLFQDDLLHPECISKMMKMALSKPNVGLVYCKRHLLYSKTTPKIKDFMAFYGNLHTTWQSLKVEQGIMKGSSYLKDKNLLNAPKNKIGEPVAVLLKSTCFSEVGYFNEDLQQTLDYEYWYRIMKKYNIGFVNEVLVSFRLHDAQASVTNKAKAIPDHVLLYKSYYKNLFWHLHPKNKLKLLKLYHPLFKLLVSLKQKTNAR